MLFNAIKSTFNPLRLKLLYVFEYLLYGVGTLSEWLTEVVSDFYGNDSLHKNAFQRAHKYFLVFNINVKSVQSTS